MLGQDGAVAFLRHGHQLIKAHTCCVQPVKSTLHIKPENEKRDKNIDQVQKNKNSSSTAVLDSGSEMDNNNTSKNPSNTRNQHDNTTNPSPLHISSLPSTSLPPPLSPSSKDNLQKLLTHSNRTRQHHYHYLHLTLQ